MSKTVPRAVISRKIIWMQFILIPDKVQELMDDSFSPPRQGFVEGTMSVVALYDYPRDAVRELVVNALVHKDYRHSEPVTVSVFPDRLEVFNFGRLPEGISESDLKGEHPSIRRNTALSEVFFAAGYVENWALGIRRVMEACRENGNPEPSFEEKFGGVKAILFARTASGPEAPASSLPDLDGKSLAILDCIRRDPTATAVSISGMTGISVPTVKRRMKTMVESGILKRKEAIKPGGGKYPVAESRMRYPP